VKAFGLKPAALWATGTELEALIDDAGNIDPQRVYEPTAAAEEP
jgi:hypothetical protein